MKAPIYVAACAALTASASLAAEHSIARIWNEEILSAIRIDTPHPPVHARNLFHLATVMYDAWAAYDKTAVGYLYHERAEAEDVAKARRQAISCAAHQLLKARFANSVNAATILPRLDAKMRELGYDPTDVTVAGSSPVALGHRVAIYVMDWGMQDGSNQSAGYTDPTYTNPQPVMPVTAQGLVLGGIPANTNPNRWQPLGFDAAFTQNGLATAKVQQYVGVTWLSTQPFSLTRAFASLPWIDVGAPSRLGGPTDAAYKAGALSVLRSGSQLHDPELMDVSPGIGGQGNNPLGADVGKGWASNPVTGQPYAPNMVKRGDFYRSLAEFWADGPTSETPPGHWHAVANQVSDHPAFAKRWRGQGPVMDDLEWDVKLYFALSAGTHNAACAAWSLKRYYEGVRPITMIRYMASKGQSSDPNLPSYHAEGLPLEPGVVELITEESAAPGGKHVGLGRPGQIAVYAWPGQPANPATEINPVRWILGIDWTPYQRKTFNTPAFPGFVSGHSTFSRAAAEVLTEITGNSFFPGGMFTHRVAANTLVHERGPSADVELQWATYYDAADQAGQSRRWGGIHPPEDDYAGRIAGSECGKSAWRLAQRYFDGSILAERPKVRFGVADGKFAMRWESARGMYYKLQSSVNLTEWEDESEFTRAVEDSFFLTDWTRGFQRFYRVERKTSL